MTQAINHMDQAERERYRNLLVAQTEKRANGIAKMLRAGAALSMPEPDQVLAAIITVRDALEPPEKSLNRAQRRARQSNKQGQFRKTKG